jgi:hypothetical protein
VRAQLLAAALVWLVGTAILLVRGVQYIVAPEEYERFGYGIVLIALVAIAIGIVKARFILMLRRKASRGSARGAPCFFGLFAWSSWVFIIVMMGGGILLRNHGRSSASAAAVGTVSHRRRGSRARAARSVEAPTARRRSWDTDREAIGTGFLRSRQSGDKPRGEVTEEALMASAITVQIGKGQR